MVVIVIVDEDAWSDVNGERMLVSESLLRTIATHITNKHTTSLSNELA